MKIAILGGNGMLGSDLVRFLSRKPHKVTSITRDNYEKQKGKKFDLFINANGNSRRFWALQNKYEDFEASTISVYKTIFDFQFKKYIYISSVDVYEKPTSQKTTKEEQKIDVRNQNTYGFHKFLSEQIVKQNVSDWLILRPSMILGTNMKKGPFYDILNGNPILISSDSKLQLITTNAIAKIIKVILSKKVSCKTFNIGGKGTLEFKRVNEYIDRNIKISGDAKKQTYEMGISKIKNLFPRLKNSGEYLKEFLEGHKE